MRTIVNAEIPGGEFVLHDPFAAVPDVAFDAERVVSHDVLIEDALAVGAQPGELGH